MYNIKKMIPKPLHGVIIII